MYTIVLLLRGCLSTPVGAATRLQEKFEKTRCASGSRAPNAHGVCSHSFCSRITAPAVCSASRSGVRPMLDSRWEVLHLSVCQDVMRNMACAELAAPGLPHACPGRQACADSVSADASRAHGARRASSRQDSSGVQGAACT